MNEHTRESNKLITIVPPLFLEKIKRHNAYVAGGCIRSLFSGEKVNDVDVFFRSKEDFDDFTVFEREDSPSFSITDTAWTYITDSNFSVQLICAEFGTPKEVIDKFDFTCCMAAWSPTEGFTFGENFLKHTSQRRLVYNVASGYPICSLWRARKFIERGWKLSAIDCIKLALRINHLEMSNRKELKRQLLGIDTLFLKSLTDALAKNEPEKAYGFGEAIEFISSFVDEE